MLAARSSLLTARCSLLTANSVRCSSVEELRILLSREQIASRVCEMATQITADFKDQQVLFVGVLKGAAIFLTDLVRQVRLDASYDFIGVSSYGNPRGPKQESVWDSTGEVRLTKDVEHSLLRELSPFHVMVHACPPHSHSLYAAAF